MQNLKNMMSQLSSEQQMLTSSSLVRTDIVAEYKQTKMRQASKPQTLLFRAVCICENLASAFVEFSRALVSSPTKATTPRIQSVLRSTQPRGRRLCSDTGHAAVPSPACARAIVPFKLHRAASGGASLKRARLTWMAKRTCIAFSSSVCLSALQISVGLTDISRALWQFNGAFRSFRALSPSRATVDMNALSPVAERRSRRSAGKASSRGMKRTSPTKRSSQGTAVNDFVEGSNLLLVLEFSFLSSIMRRLSS
mmetsp:Transcript_49276/g.107226  ORF Transcript_49276/g.107226 Transcript_49276/m.107226 type:complete len:253 (+) Transcript_49276:2469-3227(+)